MLRIVDVRNPAAPVLVDAAQSLQLLPGDLPPGDELAGVRLEGGYAYAVERLTPNRLFVVDVHDPAQPRLLATTSLSIGTVDDFEVEDGRLHVTKRSAEGVAYHLYALGEPGEVLDLTGSAAVSFTDSTAMALAVVDDVATFLRSSWSQEAEIYSFHGAESSGSPLASTVLPERDCYPGDTAEVGDLFAIACGGSELAIGTLDTSLASHGFTLDRWLPTPTDSWETVDTLLVAAGRLWTFPNSRGYASSALWPWLEESLLTVEVTASGATVSGAPGGAAGATLLRAATETGGAFEVPVAADGSFVLALSGDLRGEKLTLQAIFETDAAGNKVRLRMPLGNPAAGSTCPGAAARDASRATETCWRSFRRRSMAAASLTSRSPRPRPGSPHSQKSSSRGR